jgi:hypothetical protein
MCQPALEVPDVLRHLPIPPAVLKEVGHPVRDQLVNVGGVFAPDGQQFLLAMGQPLMITYLI